MTLTLALLPIGILAAVLAAADIRGAREAELRDVERQYETIARAVGNIFDEQFVMLRILLPRSAGTTQAEIACTTDLDRAMDNGTAFDSLMVLSASGHMLCATTGGPQLAAAEVSSLLFQQSPGAAFDEVLAWNGGPHVLLGARYGSPRGAGRIIIAAVPVNVLRDRIMALSGNNGPQFAVWLAGRKLAGLSTAPPPPGNALLIAQHGSNAGPVHVITASGTIRREQLALAVDIPARTLGASNIVAVALPAVMWAAALFISWLSIRRLVVRPLMAMSADLRSYGGGDLGVRLSAHAGTANEMRAFADSFDAMVEEANAARQRIAEALVEQKRLMREVHHRVKNNLQIVASLISIQAREATDEGITGAYASIQMRVNALALVHRWMFEDSVGQGVDLSALAHDLSAGLPHNLATSKGIQPVITTEIERLYVAQDAAVPLAFLITEIAATAARIASREPQQGTLALHLELSRVEAGGRLGISSDIFRSTDELATNSGSAAARTVHGMVRQLRGTLHYDADMGRYVITFPLPPLV